MIETKYFKIKPSQYVKQAMWLWLGDWWWAIALPILALIIAGSFDFIYYIMALGTVLVVLPGVMAIVYFNHALRPEAAFSILSHKIIITDDSIDVHYEPSDEYRTPKPRTISHTEICQVEDTGSSMLLHLKSSKYDFIEIPSQCFNDGDFSKALKILTI